jgi:hypothetical protein
MAPQATAWWTPAAGRFRHGASVPISWPTVHPDPEGNAVILVVLLALAIAAVPLAGGRLGALLELRLRAVWLLALAFAIQVALALLPGETTDLRLALHATTYPMGLVFVWVNRDVPGLWLIAAGALANGIAIIANGGVMPTTEAALRTAGLQVHPAVFANSAALAEPRLLFLGDVFATPSFLPFANVFSLGDVLIAVGAAYTVHAVCGSRLVPRRFRGTGPGERVEASP